MKTRLLFLLTLLVVLISSCAQDEMLEKRRLSMISSQDVTFNASFEDETNDSRTYIEEDDATSKLYLRWTKGDEISIFRGTTLNQRFQFKGETGDNSGSFKLVPSDDFVSSNELEEARNYAFYPYDEHNKISEKGELTVTLPATQTYAENSFGLGANAMIALTEHTGDVDLKFKNIGGYFKFKFYGDDLTIKSVTLKGNNGEKLAGKAGVACQYGDAPIVTMAEEATETLTLNCGAGVKVGATKEEATEFWFVLPPTKFTKGFTITVTDVNDGTFTKTTEKVFEIKRNTIKPISAMKVETVVDGEAIYAKHRAALIDLYNATDGDNWYNNTNWCSDKPIYEWYGVNNSPVIGGHIKSEVVECLQLINNNLKGEIPEELSVLMDYTSLIEFQGNRLYGDIPESVRKHPNWQIIGWRVINQRIDADFLLSFNYKDINLKVEEQDMKYLKDNTIKPLHEILNNNKLTHIMRFSGDDTNSSFISVPRLNQYLDYCQKGLGYISDVYLIDSEENRSRWMEKAKNEPFENILWVEEQGGTIGTPGEYGPGESFLFDQKGNLVDYYPMGAPEEWANARIDSICRLYLGEPDEHDYYDPFYSSTDYSLDGKIELLQKATVGKGIDLIVMGDAYSDRNIKDGKFRQDAINAMENYFTYEPFKTFRNRFNVYAINVISKNEYQQLDGCEVRINYNDNVVLEYASKIDRKGNNPFLVCVIFNNEPLMGGMTCMYEDGTSIAYTANNAPILSHEVGGHGFASLFDEYIDGGKLTFPETSRERFDWEWNELGRGANVDWRNSPQTIRWAHFLQDSRYANDRLGIFEGGNVCTYGIYRPSESSLMNDGNNEKYFNAPSREQIYKRIMQYSEGEDWKYDYEKFVEYDAINRNVASRSASNEKREYIKNHRPPTFIKGTWRDAMKNKSNIVVPLR